MPIRGFWDEKLIPGVKTVAKWGMNKIRETDAVNSVLDATAPMVATALSIAVPELAPIMGKVTSAL
jgi:hypothetical protein